jgi:hypothetical protein
MTEIPATAAKPNGEIHRWVGTLSAAAGAAVVYAYICGFIIRNAYLAQFGAQELEPFKATYLVAGALYLSFLALPVFVTSHKFRDIDEAETGYVKRFRNEGLSPLRGAYLAFAVVWSDLASYLVVLAVLAGIVLLGGFPREIDAPITIGVAIYVWVFVNYIKTVRRDHTLFTTELALISLFNVFFVVVGVYVYWKWIGQLLIIYFALAMMLYTLLSTRDDLGYRRPLLAAYVGWFLVLAGSGYFGKNLYGQARSDFGGPLHAQVQIVFADAKAVADLAPLLRMQGAVTSEINLLSEGDNAILVAVPNNDPKISPAILSLERKAIVAIITKQPKPIAAAEHTK